MTFIWIRLSTLLLGLGSLVMASPIASADAVAKPKLALLALGDGDSAVLADRLFAEFAREPRLELVERQALDAIRRELDLAVLSQPAARIALGQRVAAGFLLLCDELVLDRTVRLRLVDTPSGIILLQEALPAAILTQRNDNTPFAAPALAERVVACVAHGAGAPLTAGALPVAVLPFRCLNPDAGGAWAGEPLAILAGIQLQRVPGVIVLEREELVRLLEEKELYPEAVRPFIAAGLLVQGLYTAERNGDGWALRVEPFLRHRDGAESKLPGTDGTAAAMPVLAETVTMAVATALHSPARSNWRSFNLAAEQAFYYRYGLVLMSGGDKTSAIRILETAYALAPGDTTVNKALIRALQLGTPSGLPQGRLSDTDNWTEFEHIARSVEIAMGLPFENGIPPVDEGVVRGFLTVAVTGLSTAQQTRMLDVRRTWRSYLERRYDIRGGIPHRYVPWMVNLIWQVPGFFTEPETAVRYTEPLITTFLTAKDVPESMAKTFWPDLKGSCNSIFRDARHWDGERAARLFLEMVSKLQSQNVITPLDAALAALPGNDCWHRRDKPEYAAAAHQVIAACRQLAAQDPAWGNHLQPVSRAQELWQALSLLPTQEQEPVFRELFLPMLRDTYREFFAVGAHRFFFAVYADWCNEVVKPQMKPGETWQAAQERLHPRLGEPYASVLRQTVAALAPLDGRQHGEIMKGLHQIATDAGVSLEPPAPAELTAATPVPAAVPATPAAPGTATSPCRDVGWPAAYGPLTTANRLVMIGAVVEKSRLWLALAGDWNGVVLLDVTSATPVAAVTIPTPPQGPRFLDARARRFSGERRLAVTQDAIYAADRTGCWPGGVVRLPRRAFDQAAMVDAPVAALQMTRAAVTASDCGMALCGDWVYWARGATVYRGRVDGQGGDECLADARRENGTGPLDGGWSYAVSALMADPARERVLAFISEPNPIVPGEPGPREGVWAFSTNSGTWVCLVQMPIRGPDNWCYSGRIGDRYAWKDLWGTHTLDLATHQPDRLLGDSGPLLWRESVTATWKPLARRALADYGLPPGGDMATVGLPDARSPARLVLFQTEPGITPVIVFDGTQPRLSLPRPPALKDGLVTHVFPTVAGYVMAWTARDKPEHTRFSVWVPEPQPKN